MTQKKTVILTEGQLAEAIHDYLFRNGRIPAGLDSGTMQFNIERKGRLGIGNTHVIYTETDSENLTAVPYPSHGLLSRLRKNCRCKECSGVGTSAR